MIAALPAGFKADNIRLYLRVKWLVILVIFMVNVVENIFGLTTVSRAMVAYVGMFISSFPALMLEIAVRKNAFIDLLANLSLSADIFIILGIIYFHGGLANSWLFLPVFVIFFAAYIFGFYSGIIYAVFSYAIVLSMSLAQFFGHLPYFPLFLLPEAHWRSAQFLTDYMTGMFILYLSTAVAIGALISIAMERAERLSEYRERAEKMNADREVLAAGLEEKKALVLVKNAEFEHLDVITAEQQNRLIELREELKKLRGY